MPRPEDIASRPHAARVSIVVPGQLRQYCTGPAPLAIEAGDVRELLAELERRQPSLYVNLCDETGAVRRHIGLFVNESHVRDLEGLDTPLQPGDVVLFLPAVSGG